MDGEFDPNKYPSCGCPPRPPSDALWSETCKWHVEHYRAAMDGRGAHRQGNRKVCEAMVDKWLDAMLNQPLARSEP